MGNTQYQTQYQRPAPNLKAVKAPDISYVGLPNDKDLEASVLGAILIEKDAEIQVLDILTPESFYSEANGLIYKAIVQLSTAQKPIDLYTVTQQVQQNGDLDTVGGAYYIASLTEHIGTAAHIEFHARLVQQKYIARSLYYFATSLSQTSIDPSADINETLQNAEKTIYDIANGCIKKSVVESDTVLNDCIRRLQRASESGSTISGIPSYFNTLDEYTNGFQDSDLIIVAGRPAMGKTAFVLSMAKNIAQSGIPVLIFSLEMSKEQLINRLISAQTKIPASKIRSGQLTEYDWAQLDATISGIQNLPLLIDDTPAISVFELRSKALQMKHRYGTAIIFIDYLQLMTINKTVGTREQEVSIIARSLKNLAKELDVPVVALSQLSRNSVNRSGSVKPQLQDLRDSGEIEQAADIVCFVHRPEYYGIMETEDGESTKGLAEIIIAKHRNGATGEVNLAFDSQYALFENLV